MLKRLLHKSLRKFGISESGASTVEFIMYIPVYFTLIFGTFEAGWIMTKFMQVERGLDVAMREVRLGNIADPSYEALRDRICGFIGGVNDCADSITITADIISVGDSVDQSRPECVDRTNAAGSFTPADGFTAGGSNEMVLIKLCAVVDPLIPNFGLVWLLPLDESGGFQIRAASAFLNEPSS